MSAFHAASLIVIVALTGCAKDLQIPTETKIPVAVSCLKEAPPAKPQTTDEAAILSMTEYAATLTTWTERLTLKSYAEKADALLQACVR